MYTLSKNTESSAKYGTSVDHTIKINLLGRAKEAPVSALRDKSTLSTKDWLTIPDSDLG